MARFIGTEGEDLLFGGRYGDRVYGLGGDDAIYAGRGNDVVSGGSGADQISGEQGADRLWGDAGDDAIYGDGRLDWNPGDPLDVDGNDFLSGGLGNDVLDGGGGFDRMTGGEGDDYLADQDGASAWGDAGNDSFVIAAGRANGGTGNDWFGIDYMAQGAVTWTGGAGADWFQANFSLNDGNAGHVVIADFNPAEGDHLSMQVDDASGYHADLPALLIALDTDHDGRLTGLKADGTGDLFCRQGADGLSILIWEDTVTVANVASIDLSMFG